MPVVYVIIPSIGELLLLLVYSCIGVLHLGLLHHHHALILGRVVVILSGSIRIFNVEVVVSEGYQNWLVICVF
jgi:hypothetical protein